MIHSFRSQFGSIRISRLQFLVIFLWSFFLTSGFVISLKTNFYHREVMERALFGNLTFAYLLLSQLAPLAITVLAIRCRLIPAIYICESIFAFLIGFGQGIVLLNFGSVGWLVKLLFYFSGTVNGLVLLLYWYLFVDHIGRWHWKATFWFCFVIFSVCFIDWYWILPVSKVMFV